MTDILQYFIPEEWLIIYIDDILIFFSNLQEHRVYTVKVLAKLCKADLFLEPRKCFSEQTQIKYLGLIILHQKISIDPTKLLGIQNWMTPHNLKEVCSFLGFCNFYGCFIPYYASFVNPSLKSLERISIGIREWNKKHSCN